MFEQKLKINCYRRNLLIQSGFLYAFTSKWREYKNVDSLKTELKLHRIEGFFWYPTEKKSELPLEKWIFGLCLGK
jgi:hypothetical protein